MTEALGRSEAPFGVVITATPGDLHWARATCASVRYFMGDTPICVLLDGDGSAADLEETYGVRVLRPSEVEHRELRERSFGSYLTKLATIWVAPFDTFLFLDADTVVWGDLRPLADLERFDFVVDIPIGARSGSTEERDWHVRSWNMDVDLVTRHFPSFDARGHLGDYVNTGAFFARRGSFDLDRYLDLVRFKERNPGVFFTDGGIFNFMLFAGKDEGTLRVDQRDLMVLVGFNTRVGSSEFYERMARRFAFANGSPRVEGDPVVVHWAGPVKPTVRGGQRDLFEPMTFFRRRFLADRRRGDPGPADELRLRLEDVPVRLRSARKREARRLRGHASRAKAAVTRRGTRS